MLSKIYTAAIFGIEGKIITVESDVSAGLNSFYMVGLADTAVREAKERVGSAVKNIGFKYPSGKITVNLAPADIKKEGTVFDLPLALGILVSSGQIYMKEKTEDYIILGELSLDGKVRSVKGVLPMVIAASELGYKKFVVPYENAAEASLASCGDIYAAKTLDEVIKHFCTNQKIPLYEYIKPEDDPGKAFVSADMSDVKGQQLVKRAMEIAAAGGHNLLMIGPPGSGKTMLARRFATILPEMNRAESLEATKIYSVAGLLSTKDPMVTQRPFRAPHHTASTVSLVGGGHIPKPGEVSLAHGGVLFLDEFAEFSRISLEALRQPLEDEQVTVSRLNSSFTFPASFMLLAGMNPCPCGHYNDPRRKCTCSQSEIQRYMQKISGPILDRIDIVCRVNVEKYENLTDTSAESEKSADIKKRVDAARELQLTRYEGEHILFNSQMNVKHIEKYCRLDSAEEALMKNAFETYGMSARSYHRVLKLARTIADIAGEENISAPHICEALQYRCSEQDGLS